VITKESELLPNQILESIPFGFIHVDLSGKITYANNSATILLELSKDNLLGQKYDKLPWDQFDKNGAPLQKEDHSLYQALDGKTISGAVKALQFDKVLKYFSVNSAPFYDEKGGIIGAISNFIDITDQVTSDLRAKETEERSDKLIAEAPYAIAIFNKEGLLIKANNKCDELLKVESSDFVGSFNVFGNDTPSDAAIKSIVKDAFEGESGETTITISSSENDADHRKLNLKYFPLLDNSTAIDKVIFLAEDITAVDKAIQNTKDEELLKQNILDALSEGILVVDHTGVIFSINKNLQKYVSREGVKGLKIGSSIYTLLAELREQEFLQKSLNSVLRGESFLFEYQLKLRDNKWYNLKVSPLAINNGAVISFQNINTRKEIEMALEKSLKKYRNIYNKAPVMMHSVDRNGKNISVSDFWLEKMGYDRNEIIGKSPMVFVSDESRGEFERSIKILLEEGEVKNVSYKFNKKSGEFIDVVLGAVAEYDENGQFERGIAGMIDITQQKRIEKDLLDNRTKLLESQRISKIGNYELDIQSQKFISSNEIDLIMGLSPEDKDLSVTERMIHPDDYPEFTRRLEECIKSKKDFFHIYRIYHLQTGKLKWISGRGKMVIDNDGNVTKMIGTVQDITEQRVAEDKIKKLSDRILLSTEIAKLGVWEYDADLDEVFWEDQMFVIFPEATAPYRLKELKNIVIDDDSKFLDDKIEQITEGVNFIETEIRVNIRAESRYLRTFTRILRTENSQLKGMIGVVYDITEDKKLQTRLEQSLDEKNILIREVHHRVKNNMQLISSIMALKAYEVEDDRSKVIFDEINTRIKAMSVIYDRLHKFYNVSEIDIQEFLTQVTKELGILLGVRSIQLNIDIIEEVMSIDQALILGLIVSEMVSNAIKHSFDQLDVGEISIKLGRTKSNNRFLSVTNNGKQIAEDVLSTSTGIGISMIKTFVKQLKGELSLESANGFRVEF